MNERPVLTEGLTRREALNRTTSAVQLAALASLLQDDLPAAGRSVREGCDVAPRAKSVIYLFLSGGASHVDTFDYKPTLNRLDGQPMPREIIKDHEFAMITTDNPLIKGSPWAFRPFGESGRMVSELFPHLSQVVDEMTFVHSLHSETFNHDPAVMFMNTGSVQFDRPSLGAWLSYGLGSENRDLPAFVVLASGVNLQPLLESYWGAGFLPTRHQGVQFRSQGDPVLFLSNPPGVDRRQRREQLDLLGWMNERHLQRVGDPEIATRIAQYEMAFRMQSSMPELMSISDESESTHKLYGTSQGEVSFANNCLLARRMVERGVRFIQLYDKGWDQHDNMVRDHSRQCRGIDRGAAALITDLKQRGLLDETLIVCCSEFGRTPIAQGEGGEWGRDHHPYGFTVWLAGGGIKRGTAYGATDEFGYFAVEDRVEVHDLNATILHCLGIEHKRLTFRYQGRDFRLTDVGGRIVSEILA